MQRKVSKKEPSCQDRPETPEQKKLRLAEKRASQQKKKANQYREWWLEAADQRDKWKKKAEENEQLYLKILYDRLKNVLHDQDKILASLNGSNSQLTSNNTSKESLNLSGTVQFSDLKNKSSDWDAGFVLSNYQRNKIPLRDASFFENMGDYLSVIAYSLSSPDRKYIRLAPTDSQDIAILVRLQDQGWRFIHCNDNKEVDRIRQHHPICDKCFEKNNCRKRLSGNHGGYFSSIAFECFVEPADQPLKIDIELLYALPSYMLQ